MKILSDHYFALYKIHGCQISQVYKVITYTQNRNSYLGSVLWRMHYRTDSSNDLISLFREGSCQGRDDRWGDLKDEYTWTGGGGGGRRDGAGRTLAEDNVWGSKRLTKVEQNGSEGIWCVVRLEDWVMVQQHRALRKFSFCSESNKKKITNTFQTGWGSGGCGRSQLWPQTLLPFKKTPLALVLRVCEKDTGWCMMTRM